MCPCENVPEISDCILSGKAKIHNNVLQLVKKKSSNETKLNDLVLVIPAYQNVLMNPISLGSSEPVSIKY